AALLKPLAGFYALAMVASMGVALTLTPALSMLLLKGTSPAGESVLVRGFRGIYDAVFAGATEKPRTALIVVVVVALVGVAAFPFLARHSLRPTFKENSLLIDWQGPPGTSYVEMSRVATETGEALRAIPGVRNVSSHVGRAFNGDQVVGINESQLWVNLDPDADYDATVAAIKGVLDGYDGMGELLTYAGKQMMDVERERGTSSDDLVVRVYGHELDILRDKAEEVQGILSGIAGVVNPQVDYPVEEPNVEIAVNLEAAKVHAVKPGEVRRAAAIVLSGHAVGHYYEEQKAYEVVVWGTPETRESVEAIGDLLIDTPSGTVRMDEVAEVRMAPAPSVIKREKVSRYMDVIAQVQGRSRSAIAAEVKSRIEAIDYPLEYHAEVYGAFVGGQAARNRILSLFIAALIGIYLLIQASFGGWRLALVVFLSLPMALAGGVLSAFAVGGLSLGALLGLLAVFAITVRQVQMLIKHYQHLGQQEGFGAALVQRGTRDRLGPILLTTVAIAVLVLPMVFFGNTAGLEIVHPMAVVILGGLVTATVYTFYGVPALYLLFGASAEPDALKL
ncbi:MAG: efflux RND transporter permease subunit, partial [Planctomycetota bacterium]|nr:efflux RND transporter permease subunit [Planctomycetota bacterium]